MAGKFAEIETPVKMVHSNLDQVIIQITADKLQLCLEHHLQRISRARDWVGPAGILIAIVLAFVSADFKDTWIIKAEFWKAVFTLSAIATVIALVRALWALRGLPTVENLIDEIKAKRDNAP